MKTTHETQQVKILTYLLDNKNEWVPSYTFAIKFWILQYNARIKELRAKGYKIDNEVINEWRQRHWFFKLITNE